MQTKIISYIEYKLKTSQLKTKYKTQTFSVQLASTGGNRIINTRTPFDSSKIDLLFIMSTDDRCWLIPGNEIRSTSTLIVGTSLYEKFQISGERKVKIIQKPNTKIKIYLREKIPPFTPAQLEQLLLQMPTVEVAKKFNMSDNGIARWAKKWNIIKPPRGYWQKKAVGKESNWAG